MSKTNPDSLKSIYDTEFSGHPNIVKRPDGFYWSDDEFEVGPFETFVDAIADMDMIDPPDYAPDESLEDAENGIGISDWLDPETGEPGEIGVQRIEEH